MGKISVLEQSVAELIAAGEVIERPASIVKEVLENSIDAGAKHIKIEIKNGGRSFIRITDDGSGISKEDMPTAFLRHATSKLRGESDLQQIATLGFRGEALASICAVSEVEMTSKVRDEDFGNIIKLKAGERILFEQTGCPDGTCLTIRNLFYNVPARLKFLKKDASETAAVTSVVEKIMLSHPGISFQYLTDGAVKISGGGSGELSDSVYAVFGREFALGLIPIDYAFNGIHVKGLITKPDAGRATRGMQHFYVNNRFVKSKTCAAALEDSYKGSIMVGKFPGCVVNVDMAYSMVDVNVHPAKIEIRFSDEKAVYDAVYFAVKNTLLAHDALQNQMNAPVSLAPAAKEFADTQVAFTKEIPLERPAQSGKYKNVFGNPTEKALQQENQDVAVKYGTEQNETSKNAYVLPDLFPLREYLPGQEASFAPQWGEVREVALPQIEERTDLQQAEDIDLQDTLAVDSTLQQDAMYAADSVSEEIIPKTESYFYLPDDTELADKEVRYVGELFETYVVLQTEDHVLLFDKHAAHEKLLYDRLKEQTKLGESQLLMLPVTVDLNAEEFSTVFAGREALEKLGYSFDDFGNRTLLIRAVPPILANIDPFESLWEAASKLAAHRKDFTPEFIDELLHDMACKAAIKAHDISSANELIHLAKQLLADDTARHCPHGRPILQVFPKSKLDRLFGRIV